MTATTKHFLMKLINSSGCTKMSRFDEEPDADIHGECAAEIYRLGSEIAAAIPAMRAYARKNPRWNDWSGNEARVVMHDPSGVRAWLERNDR